MYLISGATGLVGSALMRAVSTDSLALGLSRSESQSQPFRLHQCDIRKEIPDLPDFEGAVVIHCAAEIRSNNWEEHWLGNVIATKNLLAWAVRHKAKRFIFLSSGAVYGNSHAGKSSESDAVSAVGHYASSKYLAEEMCKAYERNFALPVVIHRLYFPFYVRQRSGVFSFLCNAIGNDQVIRLNIDGSPKMSVTSINDVVSAVMLSGNDSFPAGTYNLCGDEVLSVGQVAGLLESIFHKKAVVENTGVRVADILADNSKLKAAGWMPEFLFSDYLKELSMNILADGRE